MEIVKDSRVSKEIAERYLKEGKLFARMSHGKLWQARRNGATKTWKKSPERFRIPIKLGFNVFGEITDETSVELQQDCIVI